MIQAYKLNNKNYDANADTILLPESATVHAELNGVWELEIEHPIDEEGRWKAIAENVVVRVPSFNGTQLFRIYSAEKEDDGVTAKALPIFLDARNDCFLKDVRPTNKNGQSALADMCAPNKKYRGRSNITKTNTAYFEYVNLIEAINGDIEQSFINRWGGEILFDNFEIIINDRVGGDYGVEVVYGKNIPRNGMKESVDMSEVVTRIYPKAYNGRKMSGTGYVDSLKINNYPVVHQRTQTFSDVKMAADCSDGEDTSGIIVCEDQQGLDMALRSKCRELFNNGIDVPKVHISVDMVLLQDVDLYKDLKVLETVSLGDTIHCKHSKLGIVTDARVISLEYDCLRKKVEKVKLGDFENRYIDKVQSAVDRIETAITPSGGVIAERVEGILNGMNTQLQIQSTSAQKVKQRAIKFEELDEKDPMYGCMALGTQGFQIASKKTADGRDWEWRTAGTPKGFVADNIVTGLLSDRTGRNYWNLDTGDFRLSSSNFLIDNKPLGEFFENEEKKKKNLNIWIAQKVIAVGTDSTGAIIGKFPKIYVIAKLMINDRQLHPKSDDYKVSFIKGQNSYVSCREDSGFAYVDWHDMRANANEDSVTIRLEYKDMVAEETVTIKKVACEQTGAETMVYSIGVATLYDEVVFDENGALVHPTGARIDMRPEKSVIEGNEKYVFLYNGEVETTFTAHKKNGGTLALGTTKTTNGDFGFTIPTDLVPKLFKYDKIVAKCRFSSTGATAISEIPIYRKYSKYSHEDIFNALTNNGEIKGIYKQGNQLYISFDYARGGTMRLGGVASGMGRLALSDENNQEFSTIDSSGYIIKDLKTGDSTRIIPSGIVRRSSGVDRPYHYFTKIGKIVHQKADFKGGGYEETYCDGVLEIGVRDLPKGFKLTLENIYMQIVSIQSGIVLGDDYANNIQALANNAINIKSVTLDIAVYKIAYTCTCTYFLPKRNNFKDRFVSPKSITIQYMIIG